MSKIKHFVIILCFFMLPFFEVKAEITEGDNHTFIFYNGNIVYETIILKDEEILVKPSDPTRGNEIFKGWYKDESFNEEFNDFNKSATLDNNITNIYAKFMKVFYITYKDTDGNVILTERKEEGESYTIKSDTPFFVFNNPKQKNDGWKDTNNNQYLGTKTITVDKDIELSPVLKEGVFARFHTDGGTPQENQFIDLNGKVIKPSDPTKKGYTFSGWYTNTNYDQEFNFDLAINEHVDIYAKWQPAETEYALVFYVQDANDENKYTFYSSRQTTGNTGDTVSLKTVDRNYINAAVKVDGVANYFINETKLLQEIAASGTIKSDGSTILNVYLDRVYYYLKFSNREEKYKIRWGQNYDFLFGKPGFPNGTEETHQIFTYNGNMIEYLHYDSQTSHTFYSPQAMKNRYYGKEVPNGSTLVLTTKTPYGGPNRCILISYLETIDSTPENKQYSEHRIVFRQSNSNRTLRPEDSAQYKVVKTYNQSNTTVGGYLGIGYDDEGMYRWAEVWYDRQLYDLTILGSETTHVNDIMWGKNISTYLPEETIMIKDGVTYKFVGWSIDESGMTIFDPDSQTMPAKDLTLYAKWEELKSKVTFDPNFGSSTGTFTSDREVIVSTGKKVEEPVKPIRNTNSDDNFNYVFLGWSLNGKPFDFSSPIIEDITLKAIWGTEPMQTYKVIYSAGLGSGNVLDDNKYLTSSTAKVMLGSALTPLTNGRFIYWQNSNNIYRPNDLVTIENNDITLTAIYKIDEKTSLVYNLNYETYNINLPNGVNGIDSESAKDLIINSTVTLRDIKENEIPQGYTFAGWYLNKECSTKSVNQVIIDNNNPLPNVVYAKWEARNDTLYKIEYYYQKDGKYLKTPDSIIEKEGTTGVKVSLNNTDKIPNNNRFVLDNSENNIFEGIIKGDGSLVLRVYFKEQFKVIFKDGLEEEIFENEEYINLDYNVLTPKFLGNTEREGYTFLGWNPQVENNVTKDMIYEAVWEINKYVVSFETYGGTKIDSQIVEYKNKAEKPSDPIKEGYIFKGWYKDSDLLVEFDYDTLITENTTIYAKWEQIKNNENNNPQTMDNIISYIIVLLLSIISLISSTIYVKKINK